LIQLLDYIEHVEKLNRNPAFTVPQDFYCAYEASLRGLPSLEFNLAENGDETWLRVPRLAEKDPPDPPLALKPWVVLTKDPEKQPSLREEIAVPSEKAGDAPKRLARSDVPQVESLFENYVSGPWSMWAVAERPRRKSTALYNALYLLHQSLEAEGAETPLELVWGIGVAVWRHPSGTLIRYPIITQLVEIALDTDTLALEVRPRDKSPVLETDPFAELDVSGVVNVEATWRSQLDRMEETLSPFEISSFEEVLKTSVGFLDSGGIYRPRSVQSGDDCTLPDPTEHLVVTDTWVLFARRRSPNFLIEDLERLRNNLAQHPSVPEGPATLVSELPDDVVPRARVYFRGLSYTGGRIPDGISAKELYFPKPYNDEQVSIVEKLETSPGVVVQGPPGTGKTHTIANVVCHYLAHGRRVLVTSKGEPALAVLREQIPESVRALTVALLTDEKDGMRQFEHALPAIAAMVARIQPDELDREIASFGRQVDELHARLSSIDTDIARWAEKHLQRVKFREGEVLPAELARFVIEEERTHQWFPDVLDRELSNPDLTDADVQSVRQARRVLGKDLIYLGTTLPAAETLPDGAGVAQLHTDLVRARNLRRQLDKNGRVSLANESAEVLTVAEQLVKELTDSLTTYDRVYQRNLPGTERLHQAYSEGHTAALETLDAVARDGLALERTRQEFVRRPVEVPSDAEVDQPYSEAVARLRQGKSALSFPAFGKGTLKARLAATKVAGLPPASEDDWGQVFEYLRFRKHAREFLARWNSVAMEVQLPRAETTTSDGFRVAITYIGHVMSVRRLAVEHRVRIHGLCKQVFATAAVDRHLTMVRASLDGMRQLLEDHLTRVRLERAHVILESCVQKLAGRSGPAVDQMREFLRRELGTDRIDSVEAARKWSLYLAELRRLAALRTAFDEVTRGSARVERAGAARWAHALRTEPATGEIDVWAPPTWSESWRWRQAATMIDAIDGRQALKALQAQRKLAESDLARAYQSLVEKKTWLEVFRNSPPAVKAALQAYLNAIRRIGKGTGIRAVRFRKEARTAMLQAYRAVPCWILPQWRVSETLPAEIGKFDLVIIDEASQSDVWALPCLLRGKKLMVVGDDKQVSPEGIGLAEERIKDLKNRFLKDQAHGDQMTPEKSLYDLAKVVFAGEMVMLREHFRCVAPIIEFSKREFYGHEIRPLRIPKGSERLDPPLVDVFVRGGARSGKTNKVNEAEAQAIVAEIGTLIADSRYSGRTLGVVSLLGMEQAHRIFELIREKIPAEEIVARKITVGDARTFQGKERDIMFLSMVATREEKTSATMQMYEQRFNVAASRARDRMYLFRSVELGDLNKLDLKARLIEHFSSPFHQDPVRVASLRELCESDFEREMFDTLTIAGYCVQPQVQVGSYRIDMVVNGHEDRRLAVECDGDKFHGPEQWTHDIARQRVLERAGWTFWRCFGSSFIRNRQGVLDDLFGTLSKMGIEPLGTGEPDLGRYTEHREVSPLERRADDSTIPVSTPIAETATPPPVAGDASLPAIQNKRTADPSPIRVRDTHRADHPAARAVTTLMPDASPKPAPTAVAAEGSSREPEPQPRSAPNPANTGIFSETALESLLGKYDLQSEDKRSDGGALWVYGSAPAQALRQLKSWGFKYAPKRVGWWRK
jgi:very-short-patch-repair endonuclease